MATMNISWDSSLCYHTWSPESECGADEKRARSVTALGEWKSEEVRGYSWLWLWACWLLRRLMAVGTNKRLKPLRLALWRDKLVAECDVHLPQFITEWRRNYLEHWSTSFSLFLSPDCLISVWLQGSSQRNLGV